MVLPNTKLFYSKPQKPYQNLSNPIKKQTKLNKTKKFKL